MITNEPNLTAECSRLIAAVSTAEKEILATALRGAALGKSGWDNPDEYTDEDLIRDIDLTSEKVEVNLKEAIEVCRDAPLQIADKKKILDLIVYLIFALLRTKP